MRLRNCCISAHSPKQAWFQTRCLNRLRICLKLLLSFLENAPIEHFFIGCLPLQFVDVVFCLQNRPCCISCLLSKFSGVALKIFYSFNNKGCVLIANCVLEIMFEHSQFIDFPLHITSSLLLVSHVIIGNFLHWLLEFGS